MSIFRIFKRGKSPAKKTCIEGFEKDFESVHSQLDDHLDTINQHEADMNEILQRLEKLQEIVEQVQLKVGYSQVCNDMGFDLSFMEKKIFMILYAFETKVTVDEISKKLKISPALVGRHIDSLQKKGVSIWRQRSLDGRTYLLLDREFRELQAKSNFLGLNQAVSKQLMANNII